MVVQIIIILSLKTKCYDSNDGTAYNPRDKFYLELSRYFHASRCQMGNRHENNTYYEYNSYRNTGFLGLVYQYTGSTTDQYIDEEFCG